MADEICVGGGCFWCVEAIFQNVKGVIGVVSGYTGGESDSPSYEAVCSGTTGHAEVIVIKFDTDVISLEKLLLIFFKVHDPTTLNRQGADIGTQYRSAIFYRNEKQKEVAEKVISLIEEERVYSNKIVTEVSPLDKFYPAEDYHQNYFKTNPQNSYCQIVINPKLDKFLKNLGQFSL